MRYQNISVWIFAISIVLLAVLWLAGYSSMALWGMLAVPVLIIWQAYVILKAKDKPDKTFDDEWYDKK